MSDEEKKPDGKPVWVKDDTVADLDSLREYKKQSYDEIIKELIAFRQAHGSCTCQPDSQEAGPEIPVDKKGFLRGEGV